MNKLDKINNSLNGNLILQTNFDKYIQAFINYYGEEYKDEIIDKFNKIKIISYSNPDNLGTKLFTIQKYITNDFLTPIADKYNLDSSKLFDSPNLSNYNTFSIFKYPEIYELHNLGYEGRKKETLKKAYNYISKYYKDVTYDELIEIQKTNQLPDRFNIKIYNDNLLYYLDDSVEKKYASLIKNNIELFELFDNEITVDNFEDRISDEIFNKIEPIYNDFMDAKDKFLEKISKYDYFEKIKDEDKKLKYSLQDKYNDILIEKYNDIFKDYSYITKDSVNYKKLSYLEQSIIGSVMIDGLIDAFSTDSINSIEEGSYSKNTIIYKQMEFFKKTGYDYGNDYEQYLNNKDIWPKKELVDEFCSEKEKIIKEFKKEYLSNTVEFKNNRNEIDELHLLNINDNFDYSIFENNATCVCPNVIEKDGNIELYSLVLINNEGYFDSNLDVAIIHELNHVFELSLLNYDENQTDYICGWDYSCSKNNEIEEYDDEKRDYELFNEIINEKIAQEITIGLYKNDLEVFSNKNDSLKTTSYERTNFLVNGFFNTFKEDIIKSRRNNNIQIIFDKVGKENFDELNELFKIFQENFSGMKIYSVIGDLNNGIDNKNTEIYKSLAYKSNEILNNMIEYSNSKTESNIK